MKLANSSAYDLFERVARYLLARSIEADDVTGRVENDDQSTDRADDGSHEITLASQSLFGALSLLHFGQQQPRAFLHALLETGRQLLQLGLDSFQRMDVDIGH